MTMLMGVRSSWDTLERKTAFCFPAVCNSPNTRVYHVRWASRRVIQYLASITPPKVTTMPSPRRNMSWLSIPKEMV